MKKAASLLAVLVAVSLWPGRMPRPAAGQSPPEVPETLRVVLNLNEKTFEITCDAPFSVESPTSAFDLKRVRRLNLAYRLAALYSGKEKLPGPVRVRPLEEGSFLRLNDRPYRGSLVILSSGLGGPQIINEVRLEDYLRGVVPLEVPASWPPESLKAQAVISRSYAAASSRRHLEEGGDVCDRTHCQVYRGVSPEDPRTTEAVEGTRGQVLTYRGQLITTFFHADCGGHTESPKDVWENGGRIPYLSGVRCRMGKAWKTTVSPKELAQATGVGLEDIRDLRVARRSPSGRARQVTLLTRSGDVTLLANTLRLRLGADRIRSTFWKRVRKNGGGWEISGVGWGHGVGLCQKGAEALSKDGWKYRRILARYYHGTRIEDRAH